MIKEIKIYLKANCNYLFHNHTEECKTLMKTCNILIDKVNELVEKVNELETK